MVSNHLFSSIATFLTNVESLALAPIYLRSLYTRLNEFVNKVVNTVKRYDILTYLVTRFLQIS